MTDTRHYGGALVLEDPGNARARKAENKLVRFIGTTESVDRHGSVIKSDGLDFTNYRKNPTVLLNHYNEVGSIAGRAAEIEGVSTPVKGFRIGVEFASKESEEAAQAERLARAGFLRGMSIGFQPIEERYGSQISAAERELLGLPAHGYIVERAEVIEFSLVAIGSNPDALQRALSTRAITEEDAELIRTDDEPAAPQQQPSDEAVRAVLESLASGQRELADALDELGAAIRESTAQEMQAVVAAIARIEGKIDGLNADRAARNGRRVIDAALGDTRNQIRRAFSGRGAAVPSTTQGHNSPQRG